MQNMACGYISRIQLSVPDFIASRSCVLVLGSALSPLQQCYDNCDIAAVLCESIMSKHMGLIGYMDIRLS